MGSPSVFLVGVSEVGYFFLGRSFRVVILTTVGSGGRRKTRERIEKQGEQEEKRREEKNIDRSFILRGKEVT